MKITTSYTANGTATVSANGEVVGTVTHDGGLYSAHTAAGVTVARAKTNEHVAIAALVAA